MSLPQTKSTINTPSPASNRTPKTMDNKLDRGASTDSSKFDSGFQSNSFSSFANSEEQQIADDFPQLDKDDATAVGKSTGSGSTGKGNTFMDKTTLDSGLCSSEIIADDIDCEPVQQKIPDEYLRTLWKVIYAQDEIGNTQLHNAIERCMHNACTNIIRLTPDARLLDVRNDDGQTALHAAVLSAQPHIVRQLRAAGAKTAIRDHSGNTPLHLACYNDDLDSVQALTEPLAAGVGSESSVQLAAVLEQVNYEGLRCVHIAAQEGCIDILRHLVHVCCADLNAREGLAGSTALHIACENSEHDMITFLLEECPKQLLLETHSYGQLTAYQMAAQANDRRAMEALKKSGAQPLDAPDSDSETDDESDSDDIAATPMTSDAGAEVIVGPLGVLLHRV